MPARVIPECSRLVEHEIGPGYRCGRCGGDFSWFTGLPGGTVAIGLRDADHGPLYVLPFSIPTRRIERCETGRPVWPPEMRIVWRELADGHAMAVGYAPVTR